MAHCTPVRTPEGAAMICGSRRHNTRDVKPCFVRLCPGDAGKLCDYPVGDGKTCDRQCCAKHSRPVEGVEDRDYCLEHAFMKTCPNCKAELRPWKEGDRMPPQTPVRSDGKPIPAVQVCDACGSSFFGFISEARRA